MAPADSIAETHFVDDLRAQTVLSTQAGKRFGKYEIRRLLGEGGMGAVYDAWDCTLQREVALKFLHGCAPGMVARLLREARAQAQIEHEYVCRVYEVGEIDDRPYIAMQHIDGRTLEEASVEMTIEERVRVVRDLADGVHAAHRIGLIHRDIKPSNVIMRRSDDGRWIPSILDFGLARDVGSEGLTATGIVMGTFGYMPPEQARGDVHKLDRRTDVYALGVTLYRLLAGRIPFAGPTGADVLLQTIEGEAIPLRAVDPTIPADIETIVHKCMEKDPQRRYDSARALADDLGRYLDGEPILARPISLFGRALRKVRKNRTLSAVIAASALLIAASAGSGTYAWWTGRERARVAQSFGQEVERIETIVRFARTLPLHDTRREIEIVKRRVSSIQDRMRELGSIAAAPGHYALGRASLALRDYHAARTHLERAYEELDYSSPDVAYALGLALVNIYQSELEKANRIASRELRESRIAEIEALYRDAAIARLQEAEGADAEAPEYGRALLAMLRGDYDAALRRARLAAEKVPWLYEAVKLQGDIHSLLAFAAFQRGDLDEASRLIEVERDEYETATAIGRSDEGLHLAEASRLIGKLAVAAARGAPSDDIVLELENACDRAISVNPDGHEGYQRKAQGLGLAGTDRLYAGRGEASQTLERAIASAREAIRRNPNDDVSHYSLGYASWRMGELLAGRGEDPREVLSVAAEACEQAIALNPRNAYYHGSAGSVSLILAGWLQDRGHDPGEALNTAMLRYRAACEIAPNYAGGWSNIFLAQCMLAEEEQETGRDPSGSIDAALDTFSKASAANPRLVETAINLVMVRAVQAQALANRGRDPGEAIAAAESAAAEALALNRSYSITQLHLANARLAGASYDAMAGTDPSKQATAAVEAARFAIELGNASHEPWLIIGSAGTIVAEHLLLDAGRRAERELREAGDALDEARAKGGGAGVARAVGKLSLLRAIQAVKRGSTPAAHFDAARKLLAEASVLDRRDSKSWAILAEVELRDANSAQPMSERRDRLLAAGLSAVDGSLGRNPRNAHALAIQAALLLAKSKGLEDEAEREKALRASVEARDRARAINPLVSNRYL